MDYPTSMLPHCKKQENYINGSISELKGMALYELEEYLIKQSGCSREEAQRLLEEPEYMNVILEKMIELKEKE